MIDIKRIRDEFDATAAQLARRGVEPEKVAKARDLDAKRRALIGETETLKQQRNSREGGAGHFSIQGENARDRRPHRRNRPRTRPGRG